MGLLGMGNRLTRKCPGLCFQKVLPVWALLGGREGPRPPACPSHLQSLYLVQQHLSTAQQLPGPPEAASTLAQTSS